jgi:hypothetical protein
MATAGGFSSNLDRVQEGKINLHGSGFHDELGLGRVNQRVVEKREHGNGTRISHSRVCNIVDTDKDAQIEVLKSSQFWCYSK